MGDSIAVGVAEYRPECEAIAKSGINSTRYIETLLQAHTANTIVISLGVNDDTTMDTEDNLREVRRQVHGRTVYWLLPGIRPRAQLAIRTIALEFGDHVIDTKPVAGPDHLHPTGVGYQRIAAITEADTFLPVEPIPLRAPTLLRAPTQSRASTHSRTPTATAQHRPHLLISYHAKVVTPRQDAVGHHNTKMSVKLPRGPSAS
jgi:hypothetical protein